MWPQAMRDMAENRSPPALVAANDQFGRITGDGGSIVHCSLGRVRRTSGGLET